MKTLFVVLLFALTLSCFAQETVEFLDEHHRWLPNEQDAIYYKKTQLKDSLYHVRRYYASNDQLEMEGAYANEMPPRKEEGMFVFYYENGKVKEQGAYKKGKRFGLWKGYYDNGQVAEEQMHREDKTLYYQHWDKTGNAMLTNGTGKYTQYVSDDVEQHIEILDSILIAAFSIDKLSGDSIYVVAQENAEYKGGMKVLYQGIGQDLTYPRKARRLGIEGKVFIEFTIDKTGNIRDINVLKGIGGGCDEEAVNVLRTKNNWNPGKVKEKPVLQKMILPIAFRLT